MEENIKKRVFMKILNYNTNYLQNEEQKRKKKRISRVILGLKLLKLKAIKQVRGRSRERERKIGKICYKDNKKRHFSFF